MPLSRSTATEAQEDTEDRVRQEAMTTFTEIVTLYKIDCGSCGGTYAINERYRVEKEEVGGDWTCPYCACKWGYTNNNENARLKRDLEIRERELRESKCETLRERQQRETAEADKAKALRKVQRATNGVCTICHRSFSALQRHMADKHPTQTKCKAERIKKP